MGKLEVKIKPEPDNKYWTKEIHTLQLNGKSVCVSRDTLAYTKSDVNVYVQCEPPDIISNEIIKNQNRYDLILAWDENILSACNNSAFLPFGTCWLDMENMTLDKQDELSYVLSHKNITTGHKLRHTIWDNLDDQDFKLKVNKFMSSPTNRLPYKNSMFEHAIYSIAIENSKHNNYFTEKIIDCFMSKTIPLYWGCPNIDKFFMEDGIITFEDEKELFDKIKNLTINDYNDKMYAVNENFNRSFKYLDFIERITKEIKKYLTK